MHKYLYFFFLLFIFLDLSAQQPDYGRYGIDRDGHVPRGLQVGEQAPDFVTTDSSGKEIRLYELLRQQPVILIFYRGVWCPVCIRYLSNLQDSLYLIEAKGARLLAITPEIPESVEKMRSYSQASFTIISDQHEQIMKNYDVWFDVTGFYQTKVKVGRLTDLENNNSQDSARLPVPATYIIDRSGKIIYRHFDIDYKERASVRTMLEQLP